VAFSGADCCVRVAGAAAEALAVVVEGMRALKSPVAFFAPLGANKDVDVGLVVGVDAVFRNKTL